MFDSLASRRNDNLCKKLYLTEKINGVGYFDKFYEESRRIAEDDQGRLW